MQQSRFDTQILHRSAACPMPVTPHELFGLTGLPLILRSPWYRATAVVGGYGPAAAKGAPQAIQVADRWHLMENASAAFLEAVRRSMRAIRLALGPVAINPDLLSCAERLQHEGFMRCQESSQAIKALAHSGMSIKEITRRTGRSRKLVRGMLRGGDGDVFRCRASTLDAYLAKLGAEWEAGCRNGAELWRRLRAAGFKGSRGSCRNGPPAGGAARRPELDCRARRRRRGCSVG